jgi:hypothetical protein
MVEQVLQAEWADKPEWDGVENLWFYVWIDEGTTDKMLYKGFHDAGARCVGARIVREPTAQEPVGVGALNFRQACPLLSAYPQSCSTSEEGCPRGTVVNCCVGEY